MNEGKKSVILVVDDSRIGLMSLVGILEDEYIIHTATSGVEAVQVAKVAIPDLILMDIVMPQMDGYEALEMLKNTLETKEIPVIFISSLDQDGNEEKGLKLGAVDYISKPYNPAIVKLRVGLQLRIVNQMKQIKELSLMDTVTKLPNRQFFKLWLHDEWVRAKEDNRKLGLLMIDIDKLRTFNAIHGFNQGDAGILAVAEIVQKIAVKNPGDMAARWADDGFAILLQNADKAECNSLGESIREAVEEHVMKTEDGSVANFTVSIGANSVDVGSSENDLGQFISNADAALYLAKELGRNTVVVHS